jgi:hypothetical protein
LVDAFTRFPVEGFNYSWTLEDIAEFLKPDEPPPVRRSPPRASGGMSLH